VALGPTNFKVNAQAGLLARPFCCSGLLAGVEAGLAVLADGFGEAVDGGRGLGSEVNDEMGGAGLLVGVEGACYLFGRAAEGGFTVGIGGAEVGKRDVDAGRDGQRGGIAPFGGAKIVIPKAQPEESPNVSVIVMCWLIEGLRDSSLRSE
jgi:hypothetical protein